MIIMMSPLGKYSDTGSGVPPPMASNIIIMIMIIEITMSSWHLHTLTDREQVRLGLSNILYFIIKLNTGE